MNIIRQTVKWIKRLAFWRDEPELHSIRDAKGRQWLFNREKPVDFQITQRLVMPDDMPTIVRYDPDEDEDEKTNWKEEGF